MELSMSDKWQKQTDRNPRKKGNDFERNIADKVALVQVVTLVEQGGYKYLTVVESKRLTTE